MAVPVPALGFHFHVNPRQRGSNGIDELFAAQFGVISRDQAVERGMTVRRVEGRLERGEWIAEFPAVYRDSAVPESGRQATMAACLWSAPDGLISHTTAAVLWKLEGVRTHEIHITSLRNRVSTRVNVHRRRELLPADVAAQGPIRVTSALRTVLDIAGMVEPLVLELVVEDGLRRSLFSAGQLRWRSSLLVRTPRALAELLLRDQLGRTDSGWELRTARVLTDAGLAEPVRQHEVADVGRLDLAYPERMIAFEYDSDAWHSGVARRHRDADRRNALRSAGWTVIEVTAALVRTPLRLVELVGTPVESGEGGQSARGRRAGEVCE